MGFEVLKIEELNYVTGGRYAFGVVLEKPAPAAAQAREEGGFILYKTTARSAEDILNVNQRLMEIDKRLGPLVHIVHNLKYANSPIEVIVRKAGDSIEAEFSDKGEGFPMPIKEAFDEGRTSGKGFGQGLYFVKKD